MPKSCRAGRDGKGVMVAPIAFVSEHSETLVELDIEYRRLADEHGVPQYRRAATVGTHPDFIVALADLVRQSLDGKIVTCGEGRICPTNHQRCGYGARARMRAKSRKDVMDALRNTLSNYIPWILAFHIIAVIAWMSAHALSAAPVRLSYRNHSRARNPASASR